MRTPTAPGFPYTSSSTSTGSGLPEAARSSPEHRLHPCHSRVHRQQAGGGGGQHQLGLQAGQAGREGHQGRLLREGEIIMRQAGKSGMRSMHGQPSMRSMHDMAQHV